MKNLPSLLALAIVLPCFPPLRAEAPPLFSPEPPEPEAAALVETYLPLLASGQFEQALVLNDLRGMRQYLLDRRLGELKAKNPELTAQEIEEFSTQLQLNDLNPARLQDILLDVMKKSAYTGMTWRIQGFAPAPSPVNGYLASIDARSPEGQEKPILLGIKKLGEQWLVAPEIVEELGRKVVLPSVQSVPPPDPVTTQVDAFWKHWQAGELSEAYGMLGGAYRGKVPLLAFLQQAQDFIAQIGVPTSWSIVQCRAIGPATLGLGVNVQGSMTLKPTIMIFQKTGETWVLEDSQFRMPAAAQTAPATSTPASSAFRTDLRPNLKAVLEKAPAPPAEETAPTDTPPLPVEPKGPVGPDAP